MPNEFVWRSTARSADLPSEVVNPLQQLQVMRNRSKAGRLPDRGRFHPGPNGA